MEDFKETYSIIDTEKQKDKEIKKTDLIVILVFFSILIFSLLFITKNKLGIDSETLSILAFSFGLFSFMTIFFIVALKNIQTKASKGTITVEKEQITVNLHELKTTYALSLLEEFNIIIQETSNQRNYWIGLTKNGKKQLYKLDVYLLNEINRFQKHIDYWQDNLHNVQFYFIKKQQKLEDVIQNSKTKEIKNKQKEENTQSRKFVRFDIINTTLKISSSNMRRILVFSHDFDSKSELIDLMVVVMDKLSWKISYFDENIIGVNLIPRLIEDLIIRIEDNRVIMEAFLSIGIKKELEFFVECLNLLAKKKYAS